GEALAHAVYRALRTTCSSREMGSPSRSQVTTLWYSARSLPLAAYSFVAMPNWVTFLPLARLRISGSRVRRPVNRTLFTVHSPSRSADGNRADPASGGTSHGGRRKWESR